MIWRIIQSIDYVDLFHMGMWQILWLFYMVWLFLCMRGPISKNLHFYNFVVSLVDKWFVYYANRFESLERLDTFTQDVRLRLDKGESVDLLDLDLGETCYIPHRIVYERIHRVLCDPSLRCVDVPMSQHFIWTSEAEAICQSFENYMFLLYVGQGEDVVRILYRIVCTRDLRTINTHLFARMFQTHMGLMVCKRFNMYRPRTNVIQLFPSMPVNIHTEHVEMNISFGSCINGPL